MRFDGLITPELHRRMVEIAREFRREPTPSEALLWQALRGRRLQGYKFRRQQPIGSFVVDFYCDEAALIVEVDGPIHLNHVEADSERQAVLRELGMHVLRVRSSDVEEQIDRVLARIARQLGPHPDLRSPLSQRERGRG